MPRPTLCTGNRLEVLAEKLAEVLSSSLASSLQREIILVRFEAISGKSPEPGNPRNLDNLPMGAYD